LLLLALLELAPAAALAQDSKPTAPPLPAWEQLSPAQRDLLIAPVRDRWNREPERRPQFLKFAQRWKDMPAAQRDHAREGMDRWDIMTPEQREQARAVFVFVHGMDKDTRRDFMDKWRQMTPQQRTDWAKAHPAPPKPSGPPPQK
jgi:hypothetical protein